MIVGRDCSYLTSLMLVSFHISNVVLCRGSRGSHYSGWRYAPTWFANCQYTRRRNLLGQLLMLQFRASLHQITAHPCAKESSFFTMHVVFDFFFNFSFQKELIIFCVTAPTKGLLLCTTDNRVRAALKVCLTDSCYNLVHSHLLAEHSQSNEQLTFLAPNWPSSNSITALVGNPRQKITLKRHLCEGFGGSW